MELSHQACWSCSAQIFFHLKMLSFAEVENIDESTDFSEVSLGEQFFAKVL